MLSRAPFHSCFIINGQRPSHFVLHDLSCRPSTCVSLIQHSKYSVMRYYWFTAVHITHYRLLTRASSFELRELYCNGQLSLILEL